MRIYELKEAKKEEKLEKWFNDIRRYCPAILEMYKRAGTCLFIGIKGKKDIFQDDTPDNKNFGYFHDQEHDLLVKWFSDEGFPANVHNSIFTTPSPSIAEKTGNVFVIFPKDNFKFTWYKKSENLYNSMQNFKLEKYGHSKGRMNDGEIDDLMWSISPQTYDLETALTKKHEVLLTGHYIAIPYSDADCFTGMKEQLGLKL